MNNISREKKSSGDLDKRERGKHNFHQKKKKNKKKNLSRKTIIHRVFEVDHKCIYKG